jgi:hypothetical protein
MWQWLWDPWPVDVPGVDVDELVATATTQDRPSLRAQAVAVAQRTRSDALHAARAQLLGDLASDLAKGRRPIPTIPAERQPMTTPRTDTLCSP